MQETGEKSLAPLLQESPGTVGTESTANKGRRKFIPWPRVVQAPLSLCVVRSLASNMLNIL